MTGILNTKQEISRKQFKCNYLKNQKHFVEILLPFRNLRKILNILKQKLDSCNLSVSEIIDYEKHDYLNE